MLKIHQPYIKSNRLRKTFAFASSGVLLLAIGILIASPATHLSSVYAAGDSRTIHDINNMQDMTQQICSNTEEGDTATLVDKRKNAPETSYTIVKLEDGNCWMQENLALDGGTKIDYTDSDLESGEYTLPTSATTGWTTSGDPDQMKNGDPNMTRDSSSTTAWVQGNGNYYSWLTATAKTGASVTGNGTPASGSICPKGWKLPTGGSSGGQFQALFGASGANLGSDYQTKFNNVQKAPYKFPAAGFIHTGAKLYDSGTGGLYWSRMSYSGTYAYRLFFYSSNFSPGTNDYDRYFGFSVRCVAEGGLDKIEKPLFTTSEDENVNVNVPSILTIDAASGLTETADANKIIEGTATATISSNTEYNVTLHSTQPSLKNPTITTTEISPVSSSNPVQPGNNSWGFWDGTSDSKSYTLPITAIPQSFPNTATSTTNTTGDPATLHTYYVGISISPSLPSGTYATDVIITASTK